MEKALINQWLLKHVIYAVFAKIKRERKNHHGLQELNKNCMRMTQFTFFGVL